MHLFCTMFQKTSHLWLAITLTRERILICFGTHVTNKVSNQKSLYCATSSNLCFCTTWQNRKHKNCIFHLKKCCISALPEFNQLIDFFNIFESRLIFMLLYDLLNFVISAFSSGLLGAWFRINEVKSAAEVGLCCTPNAPVCCLLGYLFHKVMQKH